MGLVEEHDFSLLQSQLMGFTRDAGRIAHHVHSG
jgi:hypothetical protein